MVSVLPTALARVPFAGKLNSRRPILAARAAPPRYNLADFAESLGAVQGGGAAAAALDTSAVASAVQAAEVAVEQVAEAVKAVPANTLLAEAVAEAEEALREAEAAGDGRLVARAVEEAAVAMKEASDVAASSGADVDVMAAVAAATNAIQEAAVAALEASGVDAAVVAGTAAAGAAAATGFAQQLYTFLTTTEPAVLAEDALAALATAYFGPPLAKAGLDAARGYSGDVLPTTALDCLASDSASVMVDIRSAAEKEASGVPDLPDNDKLMQQEWVGLEGQEEDYRDPAGVSAESTAVRIAARKKVNTGRVLYILSATGGAPAKAVAKQLRKRGYGKVFVVTGGAEAWSGAKLRMRAWNTPAALLPSDAESRANVSVTA